MGNNAAYLASHGERRALVRSLFALGVGVGRRFLRGLGRFFRRLGLRLGGGQRTRVRVRLRFHRGHVFGGLLDALVGELDAPLHVGNLNAAGGGWVDGWVYANENRVLMTKSEKRIHHSGRPNKK